jgi:uncharacterized membrane protein (DUF485 family)
MMRSVKKTDRSILDSSEFRGLVAGRWRISLLLTALLFVLYYGYIILIATNRQLVSRPVQGSTTAGILIAAAVIVGAWALTAPTSSGPIATTIPRSRGCARAPRASSECRRHSAHQPSPPSSRFC